MPEPAEKRPRRRDAAATRQALLEAARARFTRHGYDGTTLRDVAADVGVNLALIKRYFESKEGLFKAVLASAPRFGDDAGKFPRDRAALAESLSRQLSGDAWPEFGEHPALMLVRASGDERIEALRRQALEELGRQLLDATAAPDDAAHLLRAELVIALGVGVAVIRAGVGMQPLHDATPADLVTPLRAVLDALFPR